MIRKILSMLIITAGLAAAEPSLKIDNTTFDGGNVAENSKVSAVFKLTNTGTTPLRITSLRAGCGCTVTSFDSVIAPGKTGTVKPVVDLKGMRAGRMSRSVNITTNAPNGEALTLTITANIMSAVEVSEHYLEFDDTARRTVYLSSAKKDLRVSGVVFRPRHGGANVPGWASNVPINIGYKLSPSDSVRADGLKVYRLDLDPPPAGNNRDPMSGTFQITTNHPDKREITVDGRVW